ncbi:MAG: hypothetical protein ACE5OZ_21750, partial [Candidatus Heimdallarchaeota archaeon]
MANEEDPITLVDEILEGISYFVTPRKVPSKEELNEAINRCWSALEDDDTYSRARIAMGICHFLLGNYFNAVECWVYEADEEDIESMFYLYKGYRALGWEWHA